MLFPENARITGITFVTTNGDRFIYAVRLPGRSQQGGVGTMIVNFKKNETHLELESHAMMKLELEDSDFDEMESEMEEEGLDYD